MADAAPLPAGRTDVWCARVDMGVSPFLADETRQTLHPHGDMVLAACNSMDPAQRFIFTMIRQLKSSAISDG